MMIMVMMMKMEGGLKMKMKNERFTDNDQSLSTIDRKESYVACL